MRGTGYILISYKVGYSFYITVGNKTVEIEGNWVAIVTKV